ncbi:hypothetical protein [Actinophytocola oryzae]|uniref:Uncharacterized protein n=1 Tax=Actinophytocola oryzae TaxID=502181 RepID=A0A4R7V441_9PSEU|nr:hypothetical protein [Actinophytocola oryzae]TDV42685.1 hypothetical protein CLV71_117157 [Actinophytocola oryzae]
MTSGESMAERRMRGLSPDRSAQLLDMKIRMAELGIPEQSAVLDDAMEAWSGTEFAAEYGDPVSGLVRSSADQLIGAMIRLGADPARMATVRVTTILREDVAAQMRPFADGSGLVMISDAALTLCGVYSRYVGEAFSRILSGGRVRGLWRAFRAVRRGGFGEEPTMLTGLLRYYNVSQRVYGLAAKLVEHTSPAAQPHIAVLHTMAVYFIVGHELAHHALGHDSAPSAFSPGEHLPVCSDDQRRELDADLLAYRASVLAVRQEALASGEAEADRVAEAAGLMSALGALTAMLVVHSTERALFVRRGVSHPEAATRASLLLDRLDGGDLTFARIFLTNMAAATENAADFSPSGTSFEWEWFARSPRLDIPHSDEYLRSIHWLDRFQCMTSEDLVRGAAKAGYDESMPVGKGFRLAADGRTADAFAIWGVPDDRAEQITDRRRALTMHTLVETVQTAFAALGMPGDTVLSLAVMGATVAAKSLT